MVQIWDLRVRSRDHKINICNERVRAHAQYQYTVYFALRIVGIIKRERWPSRDPSWRPMFRLTKLLTVSRLLVRKSPWTRKELLLQANHVWQFNVLPFRLVDREDLLPSPQFLLIPVHYHVMCLPFLRHPLLSKRYYVLLKAVSRAGKTGFKMFILRNIDCNKISSRDDLICQIRRQLLGDIIQSKFDVGLVSSTSVISICNPADLAEDWMDIKKGHKVVLWCDGLKSQVQLQHSHNQTETSQRIRCGWIGWRHTVVPRGVLRVLEHPHQL